MELLPFTGTAEQHIARLYESVGRNRLDNHRLRQRVSGLEAAKAIGSSRPIDFRAQFAEDSVIWELLDGQTTGFFIEAGAFNGYDLSVTYALEAIGWTGLLVEPIPERAAECKARRPGSRVVNAALSSTIGTASFRVSDDQYGGMLSAIGDAPESIQVPMTTLDALLADHVRPIDAVIIDVEGSELDVLRGFNLQRFRPRILIVEDNTRGKNTALDEHMADQPYRLLTWCEMNRVYTLT